MGTTLTGTKPKDTYDSLIKVTDNGPLSGTAKYLSDGLGNDSVLALSTTAVGIGTTNPNRILDVNGVIRTQNAGSAGAPSIELGTSPQGNGLFSPTTNTLAFTTNDTERMRITSTGVLDLAQGQIKFPATQVASADANTLDDYEEGTFTPYLAQNGVANTATYTLQSGTYTKVGNLVTVFFDITASSITAGTGDAQIFGMPYNIGSSMAGFSYVLLRDPSAFVGTATDVTFLAFAQRGTGYLQCRNISTVTGAESSQTSFAASGRLTGVVQYTV